jgi:hypothetical protein
MTRAVTLGLVAVLALGATAHAQAPPNPEDITPEGYNFCGWRDFSTGEWRMQWSDDLAGAYRRVRARDDVPRRATQHRASSVHATAAVSAVARRLPPQDARQRS